MFTYGKYNWYCYIYLYLFASFSQKPLSNYIRKDSYYWITVSVDFYLIFIRYFALRSCKSLIEKTS